MSVITNRLDFMSEVLQDFCTLHGLEFDSADDLLHDPSNELSEYQVDWLTGYIQTWDILQRVESEERVNEVEQCIIDTNGAYAECVDKLVDSMGREVKCYIDDKEVSTEECR